MKTSNRIYRLPLLALVLGWAAAFSSLAFARVDPDGSKNLAVALVIQENVTHAVASDVKVYQEFIRALPAGSSVMVAYARVGALDVTQPFTTDLEAAAAAVRPPSGLAGQAPGSPYESLKEVLKRFPEAEARKRVIFVGDGFDAYGPVRSSPSDNPVLRQAVRLAQDRGVKVDAIFAPSETTAGNHRGFLDYGQGSLNYLAERTGGRAFFSGTVYLSAKPFLKKIQERIALEGKPPKI